MAYNRVDILDEQRLITIQSISMSASWITIKSIIKSSLLDR